MEYKEYPDGEFVQQVAAQIHWGHKSHCEIKLQIKKNANGISGIVLKTVGQETFLFTRLKAVFTKDK